MASIVVDSSVWVAVFLRSDANHARALHFFGEFRQQLHTCHLSRLVLVEVCSAIVRQAPSRIASLARIQKDFSTWRQQQMVWFNDLNADREQRAISAATQYRLRGLDSLHVALAEELGMRLLTFDKEVLDRYPQAQQP